ncbi:MAG TPA: hypothetical protein VFL83_13295 [Anaeromyxobacter sp.]|nr:hypothetical protein [Anaeromyxobacter sp.]
MTALRRAAALALAAALAAPAAAQDRPSDEEVFGAPAAGERPAAAGQAPRPDEAEVFGGPGPPGALPPPPEGIVPRDREDPLKIGGQLYLRLQAYSAEGADPADWTAVSPNLVDLFVDVRPNDRVRGFALARTAYNAIAVDPSGGIPPEVAEPLGLVPLPTTATALDQLWVNFDVARTVFVTAGRQHVKWGVGRFWTPTDFLHRTPRDPLDPFDVRVGTAMVKAHLPWEKRGWNAYAVALLEDPRHGGGDRSGTLGGIPVGGRVEVVLGTVEVGADALVGRGAPSRFGLDVSAGVWELDLHGEVAVGGARPRWRVRDPAAPPVAGAGQGRWELRDATGASPRVVAGASWSRRYSDEDAFTLGAEWFWQESGYDDPDVYGFLAAGAPALTPPADPADPTSVSLFRQDPSAFTSFQLGRQYAAAFLSLPSPGSWNDTTFALSVLGNLSDRSFVARLDHSVLLLTYLRLETFAAVHLGRAGGELRLDLALPELGSFFAVPGGVVTNRPLLDLGVALRVSL